MGVDDAVIKDVNNKMDELEKKLKNEVLKTEDIEKKLKDAEQREEALIKRITEKDKTLSKMNDIIEAYKKDVAELIAEKEQLIKNYEKQFVEVQIDRNLNLHHLTSLEMTFFDMHDKYEKSKEREYQLKVSEEALLAENRHDLENLRLHEQRYEKMKNNVTQQLEISNKKLESLTKDHEIEMIKLRTLLEKEVFARSSIAEQLIQKTEENAKLMKICNQVISGQRN
uniref:Transforming acidic coiled-coil-containing protein C-terminal domain-containing protein n=1 Tax=Glossina brevipalpis TaxID=37001 RepID=A0A1A9WBL2_9MUSC